MRQVLFLLLLVLLVPVMCLLAAIALPQGETDDF